ncbi:MULTISPECIES: hypothetical protein [Streptomyces]|uniref:Uncharacterized protein n=2 Tax=Streptomyces TaxID=1883 RepID=A0ABW9IBT9_STRGJ|nr:MULTISPECIES: hypothetical protein [Streptomyces]MBE4772189.1 hypothetical protein [Streptomyces caniscabiei]MDW8475471.1 hypothetical protein [Streptomyces scabiei]MDX2534747.1 hypothetical protein [Streptomyces scabiei]MDX2572554.1 hypothetical protein [Streptomyces scabiei]MDX2577473.1 hypothetical protein [Streptomyces scabiei]
MIFGTGVVWNEDGAGLARGRGRGDRVLGEADGHVGLGIRACAVLARGPGQADEVQGVGHEPEGRDTGALVRVLGSRGRQEVEGAALVLAGGESRAGQDAGGVAERAVEDEEGPSVAGRADEDVVVIGEGHGGPEGRGAVSVIWGCGAARLGGRVVVALL